MPNFFPECEAKMRQAGVPEPTVRAFQNSYEDLNGGKSASMLIRETRIQPVLDLPRLDALRGSETGRALLAKTAVLKLNGGLGTGMGLDGPKSLLRIKDELTFLDMIAKQILHQRNVLAAPVRLLLMNSFTTSEETGRFLSKYPELGPASEMEIMQGMVPKVDALPDQHRPVEWPEDPLLEWCPPGHGDLYPSLIASGWLDRLIRQGFEYMFVSNSDNLGATLDVDLLGYFSSSGLGFLMEVTQRTTSDRKGGHLALMNGKLVLRERAQCPEIDWPAFEDIERHRFFNTNNLWIRLGTLAEMLRQHGGFLPLPLIVNKKPVDPLRPDSPTVFQLETAMGAAIECFERAGAVVVPRTRFAPVKTNSDLLALRSDAYRVTDDFRLVLAEARRGQPPLVDLDARHYKLLPDFEECFAGGVPSLVECDSLKVTGKVKFARGVVCVGKVEFVNASAEAKTIPSGIYRDERRQLS